MLHFMRETVIYKYDLQLNIPEKVVKPKSIFLNGVPKKKVFLKKIGFKIKVLWPKVII